MCHIGLLLGLIDVVQCLHKVRSFAFYEQSVIITRKFNEPILLFQTERVSFELCTSINQPYLIWAAVHCHVPPPKEQGDWGPQSIKGVGRGKKEEVVEVHDDVKLSKGEVRPAN